MIKIHTLIIALKYEKDKKLQTTSFSDFRLLISRDRLRKKNAAPCREREGSRQRTREIAKKERWDKLRVDDCEERLAAMWRNDGCSVVAGGKGLYGSV